MKTVEQLKEELTNARVNIDGLFKTTKRAMQLGPHGTWNGSLYKAIDKLELSKAWIGILKKHLGGESPYAKHDGNRHDVKDIAPTADVSLIDKNIEEGVATIIGFTKELNFLEANQIERIDFLREELEHYLTWFQTIEGDFRLPNREASIARTEAWKYMVEAKMELGFALGFIRDSAENEANMKKMNGENKDSQS